MTYLQTDFKLFLENNGFKDFSLDKILEIPSINNLTSEFSFELFARDINNKEHYYSIINKIIDHEPNEKMKIPNLQKRIRKIENIKMKFNQYNFGILFPYDKEIETYLSEHSDTVLKNNISLYRFYEENNKTIFVKFLTEIN
jgi:hypothetical protein